MFTAKEVRKIVTNPYYKGYVTYKGEIYKGEIYKGKHETIIPEDKWNRIQGMFKKYSKHEGKGYATCTPSFLKGILKCDRCGTAMTPTYGYNHVSNKSCESEFKTIPAEDVEQKVIEEILAIIRSPEILSNINKLTDERKEISKQNLILALKNLTDIWAYLYPTEQHKVVGMLTDEVIVGDEGIMVRMNLCGFDRVMMELVVT